MSHEQRSAVKVLRRMQYFVARRKFQVGEARDCGGGHRDKSKLRVRGSQTNVCSVYAVKQEEGGRVPWVHTVSAAALLCTCMCVYVPV